MSAIRPKTLGTSAWFSRLLSLVRAKSRCRRDPTCKRNNLVVMKDREQYHHGNMWQSRKGWGSRNTCNLTKECNNNSLTYLRRPSKGWACLEAVNRLLTFGVAVVVAVNKAGGVSECRRQKSQTGNFFVGGANASRNCNAVARLCVYVPG